MKTIKTAKPALRPLPAITHKTPMPPCAATITLKPSGLFIDLTPKQQHQVAQAASLANMSVNAYIRARVLFLTE